MAKKLGRKRERRMVASILAVEADEQPTADAAAEIKSADTKQGWWFGLSRNGKLLLIGIIAFVAVGVLGAGFKYLEDDAKRQRSDSKTLASDLENKSWLNRINPFISAPLPTSTPQLAREYLYSGSRLLAVEDANAPCTPATTVTEGDLIPGGIASFGVSSGIGSVTVDHVNGGSGLQSFTLVSATNATVNLPTFTPGTYAPATATFTVTDPSQPVDFRLRAASSFHAIFVRVRCF